MKIVGEADVVASGLPAAVSRLRRALDSMQAGATLPDDRQSQYGLKRLGEVVTAARLCRLAWARLGLGDAFRCDGPLFTPLVYLRSALTALDDVLATCPPTEEISYPHLPSRDWVRAFPSDAVLDVRQAADALIELTAPRSGPAPTRPTIVSLGKRSYQAEGGEPQVVNESEDAVLQSFIGRPAMSDSQLIAASGYDHAGRILRRLATKYAGRFALAIRLPGGKSRGGYHVNVRPA
jgi:hypothetical protein